VRRFPKGAPHDPILSPLRDAYTSEITACGVLEIGGGSEEDAGGTTQKIMNMIAANPSISRKELAMQIGITADGIKYHLTNLQKNG